MRFIYSAGATAIFKLLALIFSFGVSVLIARFLGPEGRGMYGLVMTVVILAGSLGLFGFSASNTYFIARDKSLGRSFGLQSFLAGIVGTVITGIVFYFVAFSNFDLMPGFSSDLFLATLILIPLFLWGTLFAHAFLGYGNITGFNLFECSQRAIFLVAAIICLYFLRTTFSVYLTTVAISLVFVSSAYMIWYFKSASGLYAFNSNQLVSSLAYGMKSYVATIFTFAVMRSGIFFVNYFSSTAEAGVFSVAQQISELLIILPSVISAVLFSRVSAGDRQNLTPKVLRTTIALYVPLILLLVALGKPLIGLMFGAGFAGSYPVLLIFIPGTFLLSLEVIIAGDIAGRGYPWPAAIAWIPVLIVNIALFLFLTPKYGATGTAIALTVSFSMISFFMFFYYKRISGDSYKELLLIKPEDIRTFTNLLFSLKTKKDCEYESKPDENSTSDDKSIRPTEKTSA